MKVQAVERPSRERACVEAGQLELAQSVLSAGESVLRACESAEYRSRDTESLEAGLLDLRLAALRLRSR